MTPAEIEELWTENARLEKQNRELIKAVEILALKPFHDCFQYLCDAQNECQLFGCRVQNKIRELINSED